MKTFKKAMSTLLAFAMTISLFGCGGPENDAKSTVNKMFEAFESLELDKAEEYINIDDIKITDDDSVTGNVRMYMQTLFDRLSHKIVSTEFVDENTVKVKTSITSIDMEPVMVNFFAKALEYAFSTSLSEEKPSEEAFEATMVQFFVESATGEDLKTVTSEVEIVVENVDGTWMVQADEALTNAMFGNIKPALTKIESTMNGTTAE